MSTDRITRAQAAQATTERLIVAAHRAFAERGFAEVSLDALAKTFNGDLHPDVKAGRRTAEDVTAEFLDTFGVQARTERSSSREAAFSA